MAHSGDVRCPKQVLCWAGRWAFNEGRWDTIPPCLEEARHRLSIGGPEGVAAEFAGEMLFCDTHIGELIDQGLIVEPFVEPDEYRRRRARRHR